MKIKITLLQVIVFNVFFSASLLAQQVLPQFNATPVVIKGTQLALLGAYKPADLVGFRYRGKWEQIIIQADEMKWASGAQIYNNAGLVATGNSATSWDGSSGPEYDAFASGGKNSFLVYADANTFTGADEDVFFDADDELVYMARDGGDIPPDDNLFPAGVDSCSGVEIRNTDPNTGTVNYVYIFKRDFYYQSPHTGKPLRQDAALPHPVSYNFRFKRHNSFKGITGYKEFYNRQFGPNPEASLITTPNYVKGFADRWQENQLYINTPASPGLLPSAGLNLLDGHKISILPMDNGFRNCLRTEYTFAGTVNDFDQSLRPVDGNAQNSTTGYEGAFIANINGPLRAIRSYMGANSGALTQRDNICYDQIEVINTTLRVHSISGLMDYYDYLPAAGKMIYNNNNNTPPTPQFMNGHAFTGILIDGNEEDLQGGALLWEMINSESGTIFRYNKLNNADDINGLFQESYYYDSATPDTEKEPQCTGDDISWGASGLYIQVKNSDGNFVNIPNTDVRLTGDAKNLSLTQYNVYLQPETPLDEHAGWIEALDKPVQVVVSAWQNTADCESRKKIDASVFPNPANGRFNLHIGGSPYQNVTISIYDVSGRKIYKTQRVGAITEEVNMQSSTNQGVYIIIVDIDGERIIRKLLVSK